MSYNDEWGWLDVCAAGTVTVFFIVILEMIHCTLARLGRWLRGKKEKPAETQQAAHEKVADETAQLRQKLSDPFSRSLEGLDRQPVKLHTRTDAEGVQRCPYCGHSLHADAPYPERHF